VRSGAGGACDRRLMWCISGAGYVCSSFPYSLSLSWFICFAASR